MDGAILWYSIAIALIGFVVGVFCGFSIRVQHVYHVIAEQLPEGELIEGDDTGSWRPE